MMGFEFRVGDIFEVSCPYTESTVTGRAGDHVSIQWPWWILDPDCDWVHWNGQVAIVTNPASHDWKRELFRVLPATERERALETGAACRVGIPRTVVHVIDVESYDPPRETGWLPRPSLSVIVLRQGQSQDPALEDQGYELNPSDGIPISWDLLFRPYAWLMTGDEVADAAGRAWRFDTPWDWQPFDGGTPREPAWPLSLLARDGHPVQPDDEASSLVARATATGSHRDERTRWTALAGATSTPESPPAAP
jgi:hypothetical protein